MGPLPVDPRLYQDSAVVVSHEATGVLGHLYVETIRHVPSIADLSDDEAAKVGWAVVRGARALRDELDVERVFAAVIGTAVPHVHQHLIVRRRGTPPAARWHQVDAWDGAPRGTAADVEALCRRLRPHFACRRA